MSKYEALGRLGKPLSHLFDDPNLAYYVQVLAVVAVIAFIGYEFIKFMESREQSAAQVYENGQVYYDEDGRCYVYQNGQFYEVDEDELG